MGIKQQITTDQLIVQIRELHKKLKRLPNKGDINRCKDVASWSTFFKRFGSLESLYKKANLDIPDYHWLTDDQLKHLHVNENKTIDEIADITGRTRGATWKRLSNLGVLRDFRAELEISQEQHEIIEGVLISDGYINKNSLCIGQRNDRKEFVESISKLLPFNYSIKIYEPKPHWTAKIVNPEARYMSKSYPIIRDYRNRWYPNGTKVVPSDFQITPLALTYWYCGDGSIHINNKTIRLHTNSFPKNDVERLVEDFYRLGILASSTKRNVIQFRKQSTNAFFDYMGWNPPFKCFTYKWINKLTKSHRMTVEEKTKIKSLYQKGKSVNELSEEFGYSTVAIHRMLRLHSQHHLIGSI